MESLLKKLLGEKLVTLVLTATPVSSRRPSRQTEKKPEKPAATAAKPAEKEPAKPEDKPSEPPSRASRRAKPASGEQAGRDEAGKKPEHRRSSRSRTCRRLSLVAMAGHEAVLLAQADCDSGRGAEAPTQSREAKAEAKAGTRRPTRKRSQASKSRRPTRNRASRRPGDKPPAKASHGEAAGCPRPRPIPRQPIQLRRRPFQATLTLSSTVAKLKDDGKVTQVEQPVRYDEDRLKKLVEQALEENKIPADQVRIELTARRRVEEVGPLGPEARAEFRRPRTR